MRPHTIISRIAAVALLPLPVACDGAPAPDNSQIEVRAATSDGASLRLQVSVAGQEREVHIVDGEGTRAVAVVAPSVEDPLVTLVSEAEPECETDDAIACELADAAFDGTLDDLAALVHEDVEFRMAPACRIEITSSIMVCWTCESSSYVNSYCIGL